MTYDKDDKSPAKKTKAVHLNLDLELYNKIKERADYNERTIVQEIRFALKKYVEQGKF